MFHCPEKHGEAGESLRFLAVRGGDEKKDPGQGDRGATQPRSKPEKSLTNQEAYAVEDFSRATLLGERCLSLVAVEGKNYFGSGMAVKEGGDGSDLND